MRIYKALLAAALIAILLSAGQCCAADVSGSVSPSKGWSTTEFAFIARYKGALAPVKATLVLNDVEYQMSEVDAGDTNYSDGKEFVYKMTLHEGANVYYFSILDENTTVYKSVAYVISVDPIISFGHLDVALVLFVFLIPTIILLYYLRRVSKALDKFTKGRELKHENPSQESYDSKKSE